MASRLQDVILRGLSTAKPAASTVAPGTLYFSSDTHITERSNGTLWESYTDAGTGGGGGGAPAAHAPTHKSGGTDPIKLDELAAPTDVTTLNASTTAHGLQPKLPGNTTTFLRGDGTFAVPSSGSGGIHATTHQVGGGDVVDVKLLGGFPGSTVNFLRGDGTFQPPPTGGIPSAHAATHQPGGADPMAVDAAAATGSLRTLGTGANQATPGNDARLTNSRTPTAHATTHSNGGSDPVTVTNLAGYPGGTTNFLRADGTFAALPSAPARAGLIGVTVDGGGSVLSTGLKGYIEIPFACTITGWTLLADVSGSIVFDVWKDTYANYPPVVGDTITASAKPTISSAIKNQSSTLTGWTTSVTAGDIIAFNVDSVSTIKKITMNLKVSA